MISINVCGVDFLLGTINTTTISIASIATTINEMDIFPAIVLVGCVVRRYSWESEKAVFSCDVIASLLVGFSLSLISLGFGVSLALGTVCIVDLFIHRSTFTALPVIPPILFVVVGIYFAATSVDNSSYLWPAVGLLFGGVLRMSSPLKTILHHVH